MYRINSTAKNMITLQVVKDGKYQDVRLMPKNFVMSEDITEQMKNMEFNKLIRVRQVPNLPKGGAK